MPPAVTYIWGLGPEKLNLETSRSRQCVGQTSRSLLFRVQLNEYYNFGRIEPGSTWLLFWSRKWPSEASSLHASFFPAARPWWRLRPMGREEIFIHLGDGAPKTPISYAKMSEIRIFTVFAPCDAHAGWPADPWPLRIYVTAGGIYPIASNVGRSKCKTTTQATRLTTLHLRTHSRRIQ